jgi:D-glycero-alpha-D-manno-heptose 1-phosphate guanylyltransferase
MRESIILAGGFGTRLKSVVPDLPKPMAPVAGRPFLEILLGYLERSGFERVVLSLGYQADSIKQHFGNHFNSLTIAYVVENFPLGTGGAVRLAMEQCTADHVFIFNGDTFLEFDIISVEALWQRSKSPIIVAKEVPDTSRYGRLVTHGEHIISFSEKGVGGVGLINAGCYVLPTTALSDYPVGEAFSLEADFFTTHVQQKPVVYYVTSGQFIDIGIPEDYARAQIDLADVWNIKACQ